MGSILAAISVAWSSVTKPGTWKAILVACALAAVAYGTYGYVGARKEAEALRGALAATQEQVRELNKAAEVNSKAIGTRNELLEELKTMEADERAETVKALEANPNWASEPIPADVLARLRK